MELYMKDDIRFIFWCARNSCYTCGASLSFTCDRMLVRLKSGTGIIKKYTCKKYIVTIYEVYDADKKIVGHELTHEDR